jgi:hypothetical protein
VNRDKNLKIGIIRPNSELERRPPDAESESESQLASDSRGGRRAFKFKFPQPEQARPTRRLRLSCRPAHRVLGLSLQVYIIITQPKGVVNKPESFPRGGFRAESEQCSARPAVTVTGPSSSVVTVSHDDAGPPRPRRDLKPAKAFPQLEPVTNVLFKFVSGSLQPLLWRTPSSRVDTARQSDRILSASDRRSSTELRVMHSSFSV